MKAFPKPTLTFETRDDDPDWWVVTSPGDDTGLGFDDKESAEAFIGRWMLGCDIDEVRWDHIRCDDAVSYSNGQWGVVAELRETRDGLFVLVEWANSDKTALINIRDTALKIHNNKAAI